MIEINLVPDVKRELLRANKLRNIVVSSSIMAGIVAVGVVVLLGFIIMVQLNTGNGQKAAIKVESEKLSQVQDLSKMLTIQNQLGTVSVLNNSKPITSRILGLLDIINPGGENNIEVSSLSFNAEANALVIEGQTRAGFPGVETYIKTINNAMIFFINTDNSNNDESDGEGQSSKEQAKSEENSAPLISEDAELTDLSYGKDSDGSEMSRFNLTLILDSKFLDINSQDIQVRIKNGGNVTDSYLGVPKAIFAEKARDLKEGEGSR